MGYPKKPVVLVVDDTIANIRILDDLLRGEYTVRVATNGATALRLALSEPRPDIVLLDIMMPDMDGYEVCRRLKSDPLTSNIAVVFITAMGNEEHEAKGSISGPWTSSPSPSSPASSGRGYRITSRSKNTTMSSIRWSRNAPRNCIFPVP